MSGQFARYIQQGREAIDSHPDYLSGGIELETAATDTIASVLHAVFEKQPYEQVEDEAQDLLDRAMRAFKGDYEELED